MEGCAYIGYAWARIMAHLIAKHGIKMGNLILKGPYLHNMAKQEMAASNKVRRHRQPVHAATQHATKLEVGRTHGELQKLKKMGKAGVACGCATDDIPFSVGAYEVLGIVQTRWQSSFACCVQRPCGPKPWCFARYTSKTIKGKQ